MLPDRSGGGGRKLVKTKESKTVESRMVESETTDKGDATVLETAQGFKPGKLLVLHHANLRLSCTNSGARRMMRRGRDEPFSTLFSIAFVHFLTASSLSYVFCLNWQFWA